MTRSDPPLPQRRPPSPLHHLQLRVDAPPQVRDVAGDADAAVAFAQRVEDVKDLVQGLVVEAAEALVGEQRVGFTARTADPATDRRDRIVAAAGAE